MWVSQAETSVWVPRCGCPPAGSRCGCPGSPRQAPVRVSRGAQRPRAGPGVAVPVSPGRSPVWLSLCWCPGPRAGPGPAAVGVPPVGSTGPDTLLLKTPLSKTRFFYYNPAVLSVLHRFPPLGRLLAADFLTRFLRWMIRCLMGIFFWGVGGNYQMKYLPFSLPLALKRKKAALAVE